MLKDITILFTAGLRKGATSYTEKVVFFRYSLYLTKLGGGFKSCLFSPLLGEMIQFDEHIFQMGWFNHHLEKMGNVCYLGMIAP